MTNLKSLRKYGATFTLGVQEATEYRMDFLLSLAGGGFAVFVQYFLWTAIYGGSAEGTDETVLYNYSYSQMVVYIIMAAIMTRITTTDFEYEIADDIREGTLNRFLVQPIAYFPYRVIGFLGRKALQMFIIIIISSVILVTLHFTHGAQFTAANILLTVLVTPLALMLNCCMFFCVSTVAFWLTQAWGVYHGLYVVSMVMSGGIFPLDVFGEAAQSVFKFMPFQYIVYFPLNIICGNAARDDIIFGIAAQLIWTAVFYTGAKFLWKLGMKRYIAAGG